MAYNMITAEEARRNYDKVSSEQNKRKIHDHLKNINTKIRSLSEQGHSHTKYELSSVDESLSEDIIKMLCNKGYVCEFVPKHFGDSRELHDYGSDAYIKIKW